MQGQLFTAMAVVNPTPKEIKDGKLSEIVLAPIVIVAKDEKTAAIHVIRHNDIKDIDVNVLEIVIRPF